MKEKKILKPSGSSSAFSTDPISFCLLPRLSLAICVFSFVLFPVCNLSLSRLYIRLSTSLSFLFMFTPFSFVSFHSFHSMNFHLAGIRFFSFPLLRAPSSFFFALEFLHVLLPQSIGRSFEDHWPSDQQAQGSHLLITQPCGCGSPSPKKYSK